MTQNNRILKQRQKTEHMWEAVEVGGGGSAKLWMDGCMEILSKNSRYRTLSTRGGIFMLCDRSAQTYIYTWYIGTLRILFCIGRGFRRVVAVEQGGLTEPPYTPWMIKSIKRSLLGGDIGWTNVFRSPCNSNSTCRVFKMNV